MHKIKRIAVDLGKAHTAALIAVRSAHYAARPWCRRELSLFRWAQEPKADCDGCRQRVVIFKL